MSNRYFIMGKLILLFALVLLASAGDPKKGIGCADGCNDNTLKALGVNWYYNWGPQQHFTGSVEFVPMCYSLNTVSQLPGYSNHLLGFNEPDNEKQGTTSPRDAASAWPELVKRSYTIASPAMAGNVVNATSWLKQFWKAINGARVDYIAVHHYGKNVSRLQEYLTQIHNDPTFSSRPIWLTQFAAQTNQQSRSNPLPQAEVNKFIEDAVAWLRGQSFVHRYAWHNAGGGTSSLWDGNGQLTESGRKYASA